MFECMYVNVCVFMYVREWVLAWWCNRLNEVDILMHGA